MDLAGSAAVAGTIIGGMTVAASVWATLTQRLIDRRAATFDHLYLTVTDETAVRSYAIFLELAANGDDLSGYAQSRLAGSPEAKAIRTVLNQLELEAIAIQRGALDYRLFKEFKRSTVIWIWSCSVSFVMTLRAMNRNEKLYAGVEKLSLWLSGEASAPRVSALELLR